MVSDALADRYARAAYAVAQAAGSVPAVRKELEAVAGLVTAGGAVRAALWHPLISPVEKLAALKKVAGTLTPSTERLLTVLFTRKRQGLIPLIARGVGRLADEAAGVTAVEFAAARDLTPKEQEHVRARLAKALGGEVRLAVRRDDALIGGARVTIGDRVYDGSVAARLRRIREALATHAD